ncbi:dynein regulatory complex protein 9-like [Scaptodrosophila lebanonensis]|uniref:Dynein regulatory complex protein 10 n=1 Tax=Drosophila lebanonensis TaxID=7225 RepID=A0A6J2TAL9_DROLE|nr:dynein regulatory complex protein 9-like [Scaptodrosophila lebanonensis]
MSTSDIMRSKQASESKIDDIRSAQIDFSATRADRIMLVLRVLKQAVARLKVNLIVPQLLEDPKNLRRVVEGTKYEAVIGLVNDFMRRRDIIVTEQRSPLMDHGMIKIIDFFQRNYELASYFPNFLENLNREELKQLRAYEMLYEVTEEHLWRTPKREIAKERKLYQVYHENEAIKTSISELRAKLHKQKIALRWKMAAKEIFLEKYEHDLALKRWQNNMTIQNEIDKCTRSARSNHKTSVEKLKEIEEELEKARLAYQKSNAHNLQLEKEAREEKNKLLLQLQGLLKKYDNNIGEKMRENLQLQDTYKAAKKELDEFMVYFRQEEAVYKEVVVKREEEERRQHQRRVVNFMMNRAARKIQKYWRKWRKDRRKRMRKGRK